MLRVDKMPIAIPTGITVTVAPENVVTVKGPKDELVKAIYRGTNVTMEDAQVVVTRPSDVKEHRTPRELTRALLNNMVAGVSQSFSKALELNRVRYRTRLQGKEPVMNLGYSHSVEVGVADGVDFELDGATKVIVEGIDKEKVGTAATNIRSWRKPKPYKGKGIKYSNEIMRREGGETDR